MIEQEEPWEKRLRAATLRMELKALTGEEMLVQMANPSVESDTPIVAPSNEKNVLLANGMQVSERTLSIMKDPTPKWAPPPVRDYVTCEKRYILCVDPRLANESEPLAKTQYGVAHEVGGFLVSDKAEVPAGWIVKPPSGTPVETIRKEYPVLFSVLESKKVTNF